jgi:putative sterol carrier protein
MSTTEPEEHFHRLLPEQFDVLRHEFTAAHLDQPPFSVNYRLTGESAAEWGVRIERGELAVIPGGIADADMCTIADRDEWRATHAVAWEEPLLRYYRTEKVRSVKRLKGAFKLDLDCGGGARYRSTTLFSGHANPEVTLRMQLPDYVSLARGDLSGQVAYLVGKMRFSGSLPFLLKVATAT